MDTRANAQAVSAGFERLVEKLAGYVAAETGKAIDRKVLSDIVLGARMFYDGAR
jgi:hypothetical protein